MHSHAARIKVAGRGLPVMDRAWTRLVREHQQVNIASQPPQPPSPVLSPDGIVASGHPKVSFVGVGAWPTVATPLTPRWRCRGLPCPHSLALAGMRSPWRVTRAVRYGQRREVATGPMAETIAAENAPADGASKALATHLGPTGYRCARPSAYAPCPPRTRGGRTRCRNHARGRRPWTAGPTP